jgi:putative ATP-dependent endonuclease of the OLD family
MYVHLIKLSLHGDKLNSSIKVSGATASKDNRLRQLLEKLDLSLGSGSKPDAGGKLGLGSNNLLFMACELLLMAQEDEGNKLLLIEEPEAHLHTQRQLWVMKYLQEQAVEKGVQNIVTTHSPNLASAISLDNMVMIQNGHAFSLAKDETELEPSDYRFLERFLDVTKANLFFARGVMIVEGDAENILLPTLARLIGRDFPEYGVFLVLNGSPVWTNLDTGLSLSQFDAGAPEEINLGTGKLSFHYLGHPLLGRQLANVTSSFRHIAEPLRI